MGFCLFILSCFFCACCLCYYSCFSIKAFLLLLLKMKNSLHSMNRRYVNGNRLNFSNYLKTSINVNVFLKKSITFSDLGTVAHSDGTPLRKDLFSVLRIRRNYCNFTEELKHCTGNQVIPTVLFVLAEILLSHFRWHTSNLETSIFYLERQLLVLFPE